MKIRLMKRLFLPVLFAGIFTACHNNDNAGNRDIQLLSDSTAYHNSASTDSAKVNQETVTSTNGKEASVNHSTEIHRATVDKNSTPTSAPNVPAASKSSSTDQVSSTSDSKSDAGTTKEEKKGWSKAAQGTVIGAATGAVGGAIVSKHKGTGAAIGAAIGAAGGYIIGHEKDKKDGRAKKKK